MKGNEQRLQVARQQYVPLAGDKPGCLRQHLLPKDTALLCSLQILRVFITGLDKQQFSRQDSSMVVKLLELRPSQNLLGDGRKMATACHIVHLGLSDQLLSQCGKKMSHFF